MSERYELIRREEGNYPVASMCELVGVSKSGHLRLAGPARGRHEGQKEEAGPVGRVRVQGLRHDLRVPAPRRRSEAQGHRRVPRHGPLHHAGEGSESRATAPEGPHHHPRRRHRHPPRPGGQGLPPPRPPGSNGSGTSPTSARGSDSCIWPPFWTAAPRKSSATPWPTT